MEFTYKTKGTCSQQISFTLEENKLKNVRFLGGCNGNLKGICSLVKGMKTEDVLARLEGIRCGHRPTSCPDQLCKAIRQLTGQQGE